MGVGNVNMKCAGDVAKGYALAWIRIRVLGISGAVPLSLQKNAKGGEKVTQLAALRQVSPFLQRIHLRAKRNQIPVSRHCFLKVPCCCVVGTPRRRGTIENKILRKSGLWSVVA